MLDASLIAALDSDRIWSAGGVAFRAFDYFATFAWALSGAVLGARRGYDGTGIVAIALVSSCGGGLLRDSLFLQAGPPMLIRSPAYVLITFAAAAVTRLFGAGLFGRLRKPVAALTEVADALGLGAFAVVGMRLSLAARIGFAGAMLVGVVNAVGGSLLRSLLLRRTPEVLKPGTFTALAAFAATIVYALLALALGVDERVAGAIAILVAAVLRWGSVHYHVQTRAVWSLDSRRRWRPRRTRRSISSTPSTRPRAGGTLAN